MYKTPNRISFFLLLISLLSGCSSHSFSDLFSNYNQQMRAVKQAQQQGNFAQAIRLIPRRNSRNGSYGLSMLEKARLEYLANNNTRSQQDFALVYQLVQQAQQAAKIEVSRGLENVAAIISNDNATRYDIPLYEQSMLHSYQALNYLTQHNLSAALVEIRRANLVQQQALTNDANRNHHRQEKTATLGDLAQQYPSMQQVIGQTKNGFQNAYTFYLSALLYEASGQSNHAYIDYKKALEIYPDNHYVQQDVWRLALSLNMTNDIARLKRSLAKSITTATNKANQGQVVVIIEHGIVAPKEHISVNLPSFTRGNAMRFYSVALPRYQNSLKQYSPLTLTYQGHRYQSAEIVRLQSLAAQQLKEQLPSMVARQITRLVAKEAIRQQIARKGGELGNVFASLYNMATEQADTRSWSTLPDSIQILRVNLAAGEQALNFSVNGINQQIDLLIKANKITLVKLTAIGAYTHYQVLNL